MGNHVKSLPKTTAAQEILTSNPLDLLRRAFYSNANRALMDGVVASLALIVAYWVRFDGTVDPRWKPQMYALLPAVAVLYVGSSYLLGNYRLVWRFINFGDAVRIATAVLISATTLSVFNLVNSGVFAQLRIPLGVTLIHPVLVYAGWVGARLLRRILFDRFSAGTESSRCASAGKRLLIIGAGKAGVRLAQELRRRKQFQIVGFLDDDPQLQGRMIEGHPVLGGTGEVASLVKKHGIDEVTFCIPSAPRSTLQRIASYCREAQVSLSTVPSLSEILLGKVTLGRLRPVRMEDLLGRDSVTVPEGDVALVGNYRGRRILVTGAGGSIGSELVRQLKEFEPKQLFLLDKDENSLFEIGLEIREHFQNVQEVVADIRDRERLRCLFAETRPEVVFHAAAYKHVPLMESWPAEAVFNNVLGTRNLVELSGQFGVKSFVLISTDKAVNPTSIMGASKRVAEMIVQQHATGNTRTRFCCVRFGNVLGSRASVVPIFQRQIREGKNITVTHPEVRRYFMTIPEAVQLVIQAGSLGRSGEIFVLDMGDPVKIVDLAQNLIRLSGLVPGKDVHIEFTGLRPGEKLYEELLLNDENGVRSTRYSKIFVAQALLTDSSELNRTVEELAQAARKQDGIMIRHLFHRLNIGYRNGDGAIQQQLTAAGVEQRQAV